MHQSVDRLTGYLPKNANISIVSSIVERNDAISAHVREMAIAFIRLGYPTKVFCYHSEFEDICSKKVSNTADLILDAHFSSSHVIIWHFGIYFELFNAILVGNGKAKRIVCYHNVTPRELAPTKAWQVMSWSIRQKHLMNCAEEIWAVSKINADDARQVVENRVAIYEIPLIVDDTPRRALASKSRERVELLYVGRFVPAKGVGDLLEAVALLRDSGADFSLSLAGNTSFSDQSYIASLYDLVEKRRLKHCVNFLGAVSDDHLLQLYGDSHIVVIPSYHEGFCKPVIEGLRAGCIPAGYAAYNMPFVTNGFGRLVATGDVESLFDALRSLISSIQAALDRPYERVLQLDRGFMAVQEFDEITSRYIEEFSRTSVVDLWDKRLGVLLQDSRAEN